MILLLVNVYQKRIAFALLVVFSLSLLDSLAIATQPQPLPRYYNHRLENKPVLVSPFDQATNIPDTGNIILETGKEKYLPAEKKPDIDGPGQPEMKSFASVNGDNMVDLFSGDFSYNIPLFDLQGYPVNLHYNSGITMDQESSWVGLGWNINPGSISRSMRGLPDDFDGINDSIRKTQHIKDNKTTGVTIEPSLEIVGTPLNVSARLGVFFNNYNGYGLETGVGIGGTGKTSFGSLTGNLSISNNSQQGISINPSLSAKFGKSDAENNMQGTLGISTGYSSRTGISSLQINGGIQSATLDAKKNPLSAISSGGVNYPLATISFAKPAYTPSVSMPITTKAFSFTGKVGGEVWGVDASLSFTGYGNRQFIADEDTTQSIPAVGYLYSTNGNNRENILQDFNREKDMEFNYKSTPHIAIPQYTYDAFSISGEGTGGSFRPYRGDVGYVFDHNIATRSSSTNGSIDVGFGAAVHVGLEITNITTNSANHRWNQSNKMESKLRFQSPDTTYEPVYFRNPGEKATNAQSYYRAIGDDSLIRIKLAGNKENVYAENAFVKYTDEGRAHAEIPVNETLVKQERDKRSQVITWRTAEDASILGLDKTIKSYQENSVPVGVCSGIVTEFPRVDNNHKKNQLSEISALNSDGRTYVFGLPINNIVQKDVTFAVDQGSGASNASTGMTKYVPWLDNTTRNPRGKDNYFSKEEMPSYAHNFLLTGIVTPDYVDITGNGITEDDPGDAIRFNYTQVYGAANGYYQWRTPFQQDSANYNEGLKTYNRDDKATYIYGEKEMWYLNSIESKTMIAVFRLANDRQDAYAVAGENGGLNTAKSARRLERIDLYVKADIIKHGIDKAKPSKSVVLTQTYELCKGSLGDPNKGKLTLKSVRFIHNKNNKGNLNPYVFNYHPDAAGNPQAAYNPSSNSRNTDRWGVYKDQSDNPGGMSNADFPYTLQDSAGAAKRASAWNLSDIKLPSGGRLHITYESDDYGYVQNKRATQMVTVAGINQPSQNKLYAAVPGRADYYTIFFNTPDVLKSKMDLRSKYLDIDEVVYFKLAVSMPADEFGSGIEMIPGYGTIEDYGISAGNNKQFWIKLAPVDGASPMTRAALQFLRLNLRSKAYPNSEGIDNLGLLPLIKMMATSVTEITNMVKGFDDAAKGRYWCHTINLSKSFVRLSNPYHKKYGGGHRVKRVEIFDNWKHMTNQKESVYGHQYTYTTTEDVNGEKKTISSGVATYEPGIGGEENPFRRPINYTEKVAPMAPVNFMFSEEPLGESFFPSPSVGYSKVRARTINTKARSANGWAETEYFTSRDFPTVVEHTLLEDGVSKFKYETSSSILRLNHKNYVTLSQGFRIELNDMNGKMKAQSTYAETDSINPISYTLNFYKVDDDKVTLKHLNNEVWTVDSTNGIVNTKAQIGKDIEVMADLREQRSTAHTRGFSPNVDVIAPFIPPFVPVLYLPSKVNLPQKEDTRYRSAAVVKIVQRYGILDSVVVMDKGSVVSTKNMIYDPGTGNVILSRTNNEFNDPVYNFNYPAYWAYSGMGQAYQNIGAVFQSKTTGGLQLNEGKLYKEGGVQPYPVERFFESGDEVYVYKAARAEAGADCRYLNIIKSARWSGKLWVINSATKGKEKHQGLYFIDSLGRTAPNLIIQKMMIVRSGKRNMQDASAGNVVMLNNPVKQMPDGRFKIVIDSNTRVLNAAASTFKDIWKVENSEYQEDSCYTQIKIINNEIFHPVFNFKAGPAANFREVAYIKRRSVRYTIPVPNITTWNYATSSRKSNDGGNTHYRYSVKSILKYDLGSRIGPNDSVISATLDLNAGAPRYIWQDYNHSHVNHYLQKTKAHSMYGDLEGSTNASTIRQVTAPWNLTTTGFNNLITTSTSVAIPSLGDNNCMDTSANVVSMVRDMVKNPSRNNGFLLALNSFSGGIQYDHSSERTLGFCADNFTEGPSGGNCVTCFQTTLSVTYRILKDTCVKVCRKNISDTATNPYRWGILGNWRMDKSYVYYNSREETDASVKNTNIRVEGTLKSFMPYWFFSSPALTPNEDSSRWVWNSVIDNFNRKGFEIENHDALGRYSAGLYGYNQTLPVAVAQNSRYREILYDGFEDYGYKTNYCATCPPKREFDFVKGNTGVDTTSLQSHTGLYSIKINSGSESLLAVPVDSLPAAGPTLSAAIDSTPVYGITVIGAGDGLLGRYDMGKGTNTICVPSTTNPTFRTDAAINFNWSSGPPVTPPPPFACNTAYKVTWTGTIQPRYTDQYTFYLRYNGTASIIVNNVNIYTNTSNQSGERASAPINLQAGKLYTISIVYNKTRQVAHGPVELRWSSFVSQPKEIVPMNLLYPSTTPSLADTMGSVNQSILHYCVKAKTVKPFNVIRGVFSPLTKSKLTVSAWVRLDVADCNATPARDSLIQVHFNTGGTAATVWLKKTGLRIEGWQRYEANVNVPADAVSMYLRLKTLSAHGIYVDDIRVQPFNSSMKSFVYNPGNLRLMAGLDENNYASFYEYDDDGTLIRVKKETERGIMTIQETRSALFKE